MMPVYSKERRLEVLAEAEQGVSATALRKACQYSQADWKHSHEYKRNGTTTLLAAMQTAAMWLGLLKSIAAACLMKEIHTICDNYATFKHEDVRDWLQRHRHIQVHFTPTSSSWLNLVERWFRNLTDKRIRLVAELEEALREYIDHSNDDPKPYRWTKNLRDILTEVTKAKATLNKIPTERDSTLAGSLDFSRDA